MNEYLPTGGFRWIENPKKFVSENWMSWTMDENEAFFIECDLSVPSHLHTLFDSFPMAPTASVIKFDDLSPYSQGSVKSTYRSSKLICDLRPKLNYVVSSRNLNFYLSQGMVLDKVHRVLRFDQEPIARGIISYTTKLRGEAKSSVMIAFLKFYNNILYGKSIQNNKNQITLRIATSPKQFQKWASRPNFNNFIIISDTFVLCAETPVSVSMARPIAIGMSILGKNME